MDLNELKKYLINTDFIYYGNYLGVIKNIEYDNRVGYYVLYFYKGEKKYIPNFYMYQYYINLLKNIRFKILRDRKIKYLVHFTPMLNLKSIIENGFVSRRILDTFDVDYQHSDSLRLDGKLDFISTSISFPNYKMFYLKRKENERISWAVLSIDSSILIDKIDTEFYRTNCASSNTSKCRYNPCSNEALLDMFYYSNREPNLPINYTTDPQAEAMIKYSIDKSFIKCIDTQGKNDVVRSLAKNANIDYNPESDLFGPRLDYKRW